MGIVTSDFRNKIVSDEVGHEEVFLCERAQHNHRHRLPKTSINFTHVLGFDGRGLLQNTSSCPLHHW